MIKQKIKKIFLDVVLLLVLFGITRLLFLVFNYSLLNGTSNQQFSAFFFGIRFDLATIFILNSLLFIVYLLPFDFTQSKIFNQVYRFLFATINALALLFNCIDFGYYKFTQKRATYDIFNTIFSSNDGAQLLPQYIKDYWYILVIWITIIFILIRFTKLNSEIEKKSEIKNSFIKSVLILLTGIPFCIMMIRGGIQYRPIDIISASSYQDGKISALILNTPFSILKSANKDALEQKKYFTFKEVNKIFNPIHIPSDSVPFNSKNVVVITLESFGSEYTFLSGNTSLTPVLDSLSKHSHYFTEAFANAKTSIAGVPAVAVGIPTLFNGSYTYSAYNGNTIEGLANLLQNKNYSTSFFHGGDNGTMGFDLLSKATGYKKYYGRNEYANDADYDGNWGIYDDSFFKYFATQLNSEKQPFFSHFFSLSSHHPYSIPAKYEGKFKGNELEISKSISYADYSLGKFFDMAKTSTWYANTIFIITADHTSLSKDKNYQNAVGYCSIPLLIFEPRHNQKVDTKVVQQIDILPTVLDLLHYDKPYFAFGQSVFNPLRKNFSISYNGQFYQLITDSICLQFDGENTIAVYDRINDVLLKTNLINTKSFAYKRTENFIKAYIQLYNYCLINNKMTYLNYTKRESK